VQIWVEPAQPIGRKKTMVGILGPFWCVSKIRVEPAQPEKREKKKVEPAEFEFLKNSSS